MLIRELATAVPPLLQEERVPGLSLAVIDDGKLVGVRAFGVKNTATAEPVDPSTVFWGASLSKPIVAYAALRLWEQRVLDPDRPLRTYLPAAYEPGDPRIDQITARMVLSHTTGLPNWRPDGQPLRTLRPPGERFGYSGEGFVYLQRVIEQLTGEALDDHLRRAVLDPLGMTATHFVWNDDYDTRVAIGYRADGTPHPIWKSDTANAAYSAYTTPRDLARLLLAVLGPDSAQEFFLPETRAEMLRPHVNYRHLPALGWSLGWGIQQTANSFALWHWGSIPGFKTFAVAFPDRRFGIVLMTNSDNGLKVCERILTDVIGGDFPVFRALHVPTLGLEDQPPDGS
jgi:CubicO group peptidase (beta-lactamase class C family)